jgi:hypothetical protein
MRIEVLQLLLVLLYADDNSAMPEFDAAVDEYFIELFEACYKYQVSSRLMAVLTNGLSRNLTPGNCWHLYHKSQKKRIDISLVSSQDPAAVCRQYILKNFDRIVESQSIVTEMKRNPELVRVFTILARASVRR